MKILVRVCVLLALWATLSVASAVQVAPGTVTPRTATRAVLAGAPDVAVWTMKGTLAYTELGQEVSWKQRDRVKLEYTFKNIGLGPFPDETAKVSIFQNGVHQDTWVMSKLGVGGAKSYSDYYEFNHGEKTTFTIQISYLKTPPDSPRVLSNDRRELVIGDGEDTILHAHGEVFGAFSTPG